MSALLRVSSFNQADSSSDASDERANIKRASLKKRNGSKAKARHDGKDSDCGSFHSSMGLRFVEFATDGTIQ